MKKSKFLITAVAALTAMSMAACNSGSVPEGTTGAETTAAADGTTESTAADGTAESTAADGTAETEAVDPAIAELEKTEVPEMPELKDMGHIKLVDLSTITVETAPKQVVDEEMIDSQIDTLLSMHKDEVDEAAKEGDTVNIDYVGTVDGVEFDGGSATGYNLTLGSGTFIPGYEDQLIGAKKGEKVTVKVTFPEDYGKEDLQGKDAEFAVTVNTVSRTPELTDEWLKKHAEDLETEAKTVAEFRDEQKALLQAQVDYSYNEEVRSNALQQIVDKSEIGMSDAMKEYAEAYVIKSQIDSVAQYGFTLSKMLDMYGMSVDEFKEEMSSYAADYAAQRMIVATIADEQGIKATDELIDKLVSEYSTLSGQKINKVMLIEQFGGDAVKEEAVNNAVFQYIQDNVKVVEKEETAEETEAAAETEETEEETEEETKAGNDLQGEGGFKTKKVEEVYTAPADEETTEAESESAAK
ncbi:trigger factor [Oribacterium sp. KHPX15]|uniref:trigger factor n=1 Tax=Oribacterium sp. KHPX15 TaxID=1855342 RepID=UPI00089675BD|nr:trigger factor [Oribacterium sp. KHPX15]SEA84662.1 trigger factor [Oribacterium sp. KHPX15]